MYQAIKVQYDVRSITGLIPSKGMPVSAVAVHARRPLCQLPFRLRPSGRRMRHMRVMRVKHSLTAGEFGLPCAVAPTVRRCEVGPGVGQIRADDKRYAVVGFECMRSLRCKRVVDRLVADMTGEGLRFACGFELHCCCPPYPLVPQLVRRHVRLIARQRFTPLPGGDVTAHHRESWPVSGW